MDITLTEDEVKQAVILYIYHKKMCTLHDKFQVNLNVTTSLVNSGVFSDQYKYVVSAKAIKVGKTAK
jgi:hypothetical protein